MARRRLSAKEASDLLGVKRATLYAYVSRGMLTSEKAADGRTSTFDPAEIERLVTRGRASAPARTAGGLDLVIDSALTLIDPDGVSYRGRPAAGLAGNQPFEWAAEWLWSGVDPGPLGPWPVDPKAEAVARAAQEPMPEEARPLERLQVIVPALASVDPLRRELGPRSVLVAARALIATMVAALPKIGPEPRGPLTFTGAGAHPGLPHSIAARLWSRLARRAPAEGMLELLDAALVTLADHELAASTLAARVAASMRADPYAVVSAGLGVASGTLHGGASHGVHQLLSRVERPQDVGRVLGEADFRPWRAGFGHPLYADGDPRAKVLLGMLWGSGGDARRLAVVEAVHDAIAERSGVAANVDFALAGIAHVSGMAVGAGECMFVVARTAGWLAHAMEEYAHRHHFRPRALYLGPRP